MGASARSPSFLLAPACCHSSNQVYDELLLEVPEGELAEVAALVVREMKNAVELSVPLEVELKRGRSWGEMRRVGDALSN